MESKKNLSECKTAEELVVLAKENGRDITLEEAQIYLDGKVEVQEISDDKLESVAGGGCFPSGGVKRGEKCPKCKGTNTYQRIGAADAEFKCYDCNYYYHTLL